jgi:hypothetical protein
VTTACSDMWDLRALRVSRPASKLYIQHRYPKALGLDILDLDILNATILHIRLLGSPKAIGFHVGLMFHKSNEIGDKTLERESQFFCYISQ